MNKFQVDSFLSPMFQHYAILGHYDNNNNNATLTLPQYIKIIVLLLCT